MKAWNYLSLCIIATVGCMASETWETDIEKAKQKAVADNKGILIEFTGSDWCGPCMRMKKDVLSNEEFLKIAQQNFILVELDYPRRKLPQQQREHNELYKQKYSITAFPTIIFTDSQGRPVHAFLGSRELQAALEEVGKASQAWKTRDETLLKLDQATENERWPLLRKLFETIPLQYADQYYPEQASAIKQDHDNKSGLNTQLRELAADKQYHDFIAKLRQEGKHASDQARQAFDQASREPGLEPALKQKYLESQAIILAGELKIDEAIAKMDEAINTYQGSKNETLIKRRDDWRTNKEEIILHAKQRREYHQYRTNLDPATANDPALYLDAVRQYIEGKTLSQGMKALTTTEMANALIALDKTDEAIALIQTTIDRIPAGTTTAPIEQLKRIKTAIDQDRETYIKNTKRMWDSKRQGNIIPAIPMR